MKKKIKTFAHKLKILSSPSKGNAAKQLVKEEIWETTILSRFIRWIFFRLHFSQCRYCIYCKAQGDSYKGMRESILLNRGTCHWAEKSISSQL